MNRTSKVLKRATEFPYVLRIRALYADPGRRARSSSDPTAYCSAGADFARSTHLSADPNADSNFECYFAAHTDS